MCMAKNKKMCSYCGSQLQADAKFCRHCGRPCEEVQEQEEKEEEEGKGKGKRQQNQSETVQTQ